MRMNFSTGLVIYIPNQQKKNHSFSFFSTFSFKVFVGFGTQKAFWHSYPAPFLIAWKLPITFRISYALMDSKCAFISIVKCAQKLFSPLRKASYSYIYKNEKWKVYAINGYPIWNGTLLYQREEMREKKDNNKQHDLRSDLLLIFHYTVNNFQLMTVS